MRTRKENLGNSTLGAGSGKRWARDDEMEAQRVRAPKLDKTFYKRP